MVPAIWFLELHNMNERIYDKNNLNTTLPEIIEINNTDEDLSVNIKGVRLLLLLLFCIRNEFGSSFLS